MKKNYITLKRLNKILATLDKNGGKTIIYSNHDKKTCFEIKKISTILYSLKVYKKAVAPCLEIDFFTKDKAKNIVQVLNNIFELNLYLNNFINNL